MFRKLKVLLEIGMYRYLLPSQTTEVQFQGLDGLARYALMQVVA